MALNALCMCALHQRIGEIDQEEEKEEKNIQKLNQRGKGGGTTGRGRYSTFWGHLDTYNVTHCSKQVFEFSVIENRNVLYITKIERRIKKQF